MDYEKAYKDALERAKEQLNGAKVFDYDNEQIAHNIRNTVYNIFPELKESEDEKVKRGIIKFLKENKDFPEDWIAWLEKQGEQKPTWSEEDEGVLYLTISLLDKFKEEAYTNDCEDCINWLKSLKQQPHWKPTEEQLMALRDAIDNNEMESLYNDLKKL